MSFENTTPKTARTGRRNVVTATAIGGIAFLSSKGLASRQSVGPNASGTPAAASPVATPEPSTVVFPGARPSVPFPLEVIRDQRPVETETPVSGGELRLFVQSADLADFSPVSFRQDFQIASSLYDPLVWLDEVTCEPKPCLAESWAWSIDGLTLTFTIRNDVTWHDGSPLTAADVAFSFIAYQQDPASAVSGFFSLVTDIKSTDDRTVKVSFSETDGSFLFTAGNLFVFPSRQYAFLWSSRPEGERTFQGYDWKTNPPIGSGPWQFDSATETQVSLKRNDAYWVAPAHADHLVLIAEDDRSKQIDAWKNDEVDIVWPVAPLATSDLVKESGRLYAADTLRTLFAAYNFDNPERITPGLFLKLEFRQALVLAMNREAYQQSIFGSFIDTTRAGSIPQPWARDDRIVNPERNVEIANRLLDSIGWVDTDGDGIRETPEGDVLSLVAIVESDAPTELVEILQSLDRDFSDIGVSLNVDILDSAAWTDRWMVTHDFDLIGYSLLGYGAFDEFDLYGSAWNIRVNSNGWNPGAYSNEAVDAALDEWFAAFRPDDLKIALYKLQRAVTDDPFGLFFGCPQDPVLVRPGIRGFQPNKMWQSWDTRVMWKALPS